MFRSKSTLNEPQPKRKGQKIQAIIFDLGRVLIDVQFKPGSLRFLGVEHSDNIDQIYDRAFQNEWVRKFNTGKISPKEFYRGFCEQFNLKLDYKAFVQQWCDVFAPLDDMEALFLRLRKKYPVGLLSDTDALHWQFCLENFSFLKSIPNPTLSFEIGALKPDPICYFKAAQNVGFSAQECLFIDDRPLNVKGAQQVGMPAIRFESKEQLERDLKKLGIDF